VTVVDTSVWIDFFNGAQSTEVELLDRSLGRRTIVVGDLIVAEVLQGFRSEADVDAARVALSNFEVVPMVGAGMAMKSAANYRRLQRLGVTVRKTIDMMIATWCVEHGHDLLYSDREFDACVRHLGLRSARLPGQGCRSRDGRRRGSRP
jgi:predicted nucleic acid-binding protein